MKRIPLGHGKYALVSDIDFEEVMKYDWHFGKKYAERTVRENGKMRHEPMHIFIARRIGLNIDGIIDHINRDYLDYQRENLREANEFQNNANRSTPKNNTTGAKGVCRRKSLNKWVASICCEKTTYCLGTYNTFEEAVYAYYLASKILHKEFSNVDFDINSISAEARFRIRRKIRDKLRHHIIRHVDTYKMPGENGLSYIFTSSDLDTISHIK